MQNEQPSKLAQVVDAVSPQLAEWAAAHDSENRFVSAGYDLLKSHKFFGAGVPEALGGLGASHADLCDALRRLAHACPSTALAASMHTHLVAATVWKYRQGQGGEPLLRRVAAEQLVLVSTGAGDWFESNGKLERVTDGYKLTARKIFCSGSPGGNLLVTSGVFQEGEGDGGADGAQVFHFAVPLSAPGVKIAADWDSMGMRGTGSQTVELDGVFVPEQSVVLRRPRKGWHPVWSVVLTVAPPLYMSPYLGVAEAARDRALQCARVHTDGNRRVREETPLLVGEMETELATARMAWSELVANAANYEFTPDVARANRALVAKTILANAVVRTVEKAMEVAGGAAYFRRTGIERLVRDAHGAPYHPLPERQQQLLTGRLALGLDPLATGG